MGLRISYKIPLKGSHLILTKYRRLGSLPDVPEDILTLNLLYRVSGIISLSGILLQDVIQCSSTVVSAVYFHIHEGAVVLHGHAAVI